MKWKYSTSAGEQCFIRVYFNKIWNKPESSIDRKPKEYVCGHRHKKIELISVKKAMVSDEQKLRLDLKSCEHNKRFKLSHPVPW